MYWFYVPEMQKRTSTDCRNFRSYRGSNKASCAAQPGGFLCLFFRKDSVDSGAITITINMEATMPTRAKQCVIHPGQTVRLKPQEETVLTVKSGRLWVTQTGDPHDYFLEAGQQLRLRHTRTVLEAENDTPALCLWTHEAPKRRFFSWIWARTFDPSGDQHLTQLVH